ncbi:MAG: NUDIX domain-containing protein [Candidatus Ratteibacteria bacterium]|jgi:dATP pyrophosphohydrolase
MDIREETPIKSFSITAYICRIENGRGKYLLLKRCTSYLEGTWQMVSGRLEKGEKAWEAALREIREETGLIPDRLYSTGEVEVFYEVNQNCINIVPVFVAFIDSDQEVKISAEHSDYNWTTVDEASKRLGFEQQKRMTKKIEDIFVCQKPNEFLRIQGR